MKVIGIIPARFNSSRFPGKPLHKIAGKEMLKWVYDGAITSTKLDNLVVATDDSNIYEFCKREEMNVVLTSPHHNTGTSRCIEALNFLDVDNFDVMLNIQGDEPLINNIPIDLLIESFKSPEVEISTLYNEVESELYFNNHNKVKMVLDKNGKVLYFSRANIPHLNSIKNALINCHIGIYGFRTNVISKISTLNTSKLEEYESLEQLTWLYEGLNIYASKTDYEVFGVDTLEDVKTIEQKLSNYNVS